MSSLSFAACGHKGALAHFIWVWCGLGLAAAALEAAANTLVVKRPSSELARSSPGKKESGASDKQQADACIKRHSSVPLLLDGVRREPLSCVQTSLLPRLVRPIVCAAAKSNANEDPRAALPHCGRRGRSGNSHAYQSAQLYRANEHLHPIIIPN
jgi:hypothetical protein